MLKKEIEEAFSLLCKKAERPGIIGFVPIEGVGLLREQEAYLRRKLTGMESALSVAEGLKSDITAISIGLFYHVSEILAIPSGWVNKHPDYGHWNLYARAYTELNRQLNEIATRLTEQFGGVAVQATMEGKVGQVNHVNDYFPHCVSHRAFAEAAGLGWRGKHGLTVTPDAGPVLRFATVFVPQHILPDKKSLPDCGDCNACLEVCPILRSEEGYRERCRRQIFTLGLEDEVCGICVRVCWEANQTIEK